MGKQPQKKNSQRNSQPRGVRGSRYVVNGRTYAIEEASHGSIADQMIADGYRPGARCKWRGVEYTLEVDHHFGGGRLKARTTTELENAL